MASRTTRKTASLIVSDLAPKCLAMKLAPPAVFVTDQMILPELTSAIMSVMVTSGAEIFPVLTSPNFPTEPKIIA